ncbi:MAG: hemerythrin domain-containing protein [Planctomycetes bacterium]|nr:hemerythrin domain-containing protein [Planctomycetota bacterium]
MSRPSIIPLLKKDHKEVNALFKEALATSDNAGDKRTQLFSQINEALTLHTRFEEENVYPLLLEQRKTKEDTLEAEEEHAQIKHLLSDIAETASDDERWKPKIMVLAEDVHHHVKEEEKAGGLFEELKKAVDDETLAALAEQFQASKNAAVS